jgi:hypothetical protein
MGTYVATPHLRALPGPHHQHEWVLSTHEAMRGPILVNGGAGTLKAECICGAIEWVPNRLPIEVPQ